MDKVHDTLIKRKTEILQENLVILRKLANWSATSLAARLGVTKQNISLIENLKNHLTQTQYIAIRTLFDRHIMDHRYNIYLPMALYYLLDNPSTPQANQDKQEVFSLLASQIYGQPLFDYAKDSTKKLLAMVHITLEDKFFTQGFTPYIIHAWQHELRPDTLYFPDYHAIHAIQQLLDSYQKPSQNSAQLLSGVVGEVAGALVLGAFEMSRKSKSSQQESLSQGRRDCLDQLKRMTATMSLPKEELAYLEHIAKMLTHDMESTDDS